MFVDEIHLLLLTENYDSKVMCSQKLMFSFHETGFSGKKFDSRPKNPVLVRQFHVDSEFEVTNSQSLQPEGKNKEKRNQRNLCFNRFGS